MLQTLDRTELTRIRDLVSREEMRAVNEHNSKMLMWWESLRLKLDIVIEQLDESVVRDYDEGD